MIVSFNTLAVEFLALLGWCSVTTSEVGCVGMEEMENRVCSRGCQAGVAGRRRQEGDKECLFSTSLEMLCGGQFLLVDIEREECNS